MPLGSIELLVVKFPGNQFKGEIIPALKELVNNNIVRIVDILFIQKDVQGNLNVREISDLDEEDYTTFDPLVSDVSGLMPEQDVLQISQTLENNSSVAMMLFENTWAIRFSDAINNAKGEVLLSERVSSEIVQAAVAAQTLMTA